MLLVAFFFSLSENTLDQDHTWEAGTIPCLEAGNGVSVDSSPAKAEEGPEGVVWVMKSELRKSWLLIWSDIGSVSLNKSSSFSVSRHKLRTMSFTLRRCTNLVASREYSWSPCFHFLRARVAGLHHRTLTSTAFSKLKSDINIREPSSLLRLQGMPRNASTNTETFGPLLLVMWSRTAQPLSLGHS